MRPTLPHNRDFQSLRKGFRWDIPARLSMAAQACHDWAARDPGRVALIDLSDGARTDISYARLAGMTHALAAHLAAAGVQRGDRVGVLRTQSGWTAAAHLAIWHLGAISIPLFRLFGRDALDTRLRDSAAAHVVTDAEGFDLLDGFDLLRHIPEELPLDFDTCHPMADTGPEDPAVLMYTSGTTGAPKGALHGHRVLSGHLPGVEISHDMLGQPGDCLWTPADWAWIGGLFDVLMPGLALGVPVVAARMAKFDSVECVNIIREATVRNVFFPPTALKRLRADGVRIPGLRSVGSGGEPLGAEMLAWGQTAFGLTINEFYGQTECNMVASSCAALFAPRPGAIGRTVPGFDLAVLDPDGQPTSGEGDIAIRRGAASMFLCYWNNPLATADKFAGDWMRTGDQGVWDGDYLRFVGRADDVITSAGYRIGPAEIEDCLMHHPAVAVAAVVGLPDPARTEAVTACIVVAPGHVPDMALAEALRAHVGRHLSPHMTPRAVHFMDTLPMTVTGKVQRKRLRETLVEQEDTA